MKQTKKRVLIYPAGTEIGLEMARSLKDNKHFEVWGGSSGDDHSEVVFDKVVYIANVYDTEAAIEDLAEIDVDYIMPAHDEAIYLLARHRDSLKGEVVAPPFYLVEVCRLKSATYKTFPAFSPKIYPIDDEKSIHLNVPLFCKPDRGQGSRGAHKVETSFDIDQARSNTGNIIMEYLPGPEYTVDCFTDRKGRLLFSHMRSRDRVKAGIAVRTVPVVMNEETRTIANLINKRVGMRGAWFFQLKQNSKGRMTLLEIAPRIAGSSGLWRAYGVNLTELMLWDFMGHDVKIQYNRDVGLVAMDRSLECRYIKRDTPFQLDRIYVDFDDTIMMADGTYNDALVAFLVQANLKGANISILTRSNENLFDLDIIGYLADQVLVCETGEPKSSAIQSGNCIFIDDSYAERYEVSTNRGVPCFSPSDGPMLLDLFFGAV